MNPIQETTSYLSNWIFTVVLIVICFFVLLVMKRFLLTAKLQKESKNTLLKQLLFLGILGVCIVMIVVSLPIGEKMRTQLLSLIGIFVTAAVALSSTTFLGNLMAGFMLRSIRSFSPGDFIEVDDIFGRVSEYGFLHTEVQTEDRNLTTLPNLLLVTQAVKVYRSSGTVIWAEISLGYDTRKEQIIDKLAEAATSVGLESVFVHIKELGDFSVTYRVSGFLKEIKSIVSSRSNLRSAMITHLHGANIEIVSPTFMNQRVYDPSATFMAKSLLKKAEEYTVKRAEDLIFDKADQVENLEEIKDRKDKLLTDVKDMKSELSKTKDDQEKQKVEKALNKKQRAIEHLTTAIEKKSDELRDE